MSALCLATALASFGCGEEGDGAALDDEDAAQLANAGDAGWPARDASISNRDTGIPDATSDARDPNGEPADDAAGTSDDQRSEGCGKAKTGSRDFERRTLRAGSRDRTYHVRIPDSYQASHAYPVVFRWHGTGGDGLSGGLDIEYAVGDDAIVVGADGLAGADGPELRWGADSETDDLALFDAMYQQLTQEYCVDLKRVFSYGFSAGGGMTNMLSCKRGDKLRASAAIAGYVWGDQSACSTPVAAWFLHDRGDDAVLVAEGRKARDLALQRNDCGTTTTPAADGCLSYDGCKPGYPVIWCETQGLGHNIAGETAPAQVWSFFSALP